jgi:hypothetical protein
MQETINDEDIKAKKEWIVTYFDGIVWLKITNLDKIIEEGFIEEALTLALCYIDAMANFYQRKSGDRKKTFIDTIYDYSDFEESFSKISRIFLVRNGKDTSGEKTRPGTPISCYEEIKAALLEKYGRNNNHHKEMDKKGVIQYLKSKLNSCDWKNIETNLDKFSYAAVLYEKSRSAGVHEMGFETMIHKGEPSFEQNKQGEDIYYSGDILCFSKEIILSTLKNVHQNLRRKCLDEAKWPCELDENSS